MQPAVSASAGRFLYVVIAVLSFAGIAVSAIALQRHYATSATNFCDFNQQFNCDIVNRSEWSTMAGIPVAGIGVAGYLALFFLAAFRKSRAETPNLLLAGSAIGMIFALYLTYIEAHELMTWCILCVASQIIIFLILVASAIINWRAAKA